MIFYADHCRQMIGQVERMDVHSENVSGMIFRIF